MAAAVIFDALCFKALDETVKRFFNLCADFVSDAFDDAFIIDAGKAQKQINNKWDGLTECGFDACGGRCAADDLRRASANGEDDGVRVFQTGVR